MSRKYFKNQQNGYDKNQVDNYISNLMKIYQKAYHEYLDIVDKHNALKEAVKDEMLKKERLKVKRVLRRYYV